MIWRPSFFLSFFMQVARYTIRCGLKLFFSGGSCHLLLGLKQGYPLYSPYGCRLRYHQSEAWLVEQKALPPQFYVASVTTGIWTHTLLIKHQSLNPVLLTARPWHADLKRKEEVFLSRRPHGPSQSQHKSLIHEHGSAASILSCFIVITKWNEV